MDTSGVLDVHERPTTAQTQSVEDEYHRIRTRLRVAQQSGRGVKLTPREVHLMGLTILGEWWHDPEIDPACKKQES